MLDVRDMDAVLDGVIVLEAVSGAVTLAVCDSVIV